MFHLFKSTDMRNTAKATEDRIKREAQLDLARVNEQVEEIAFEATLLQKLIDLLKVALQDSACNDLTTHVDNAIKEAQAEMLKTQRGYYEYHESYTDETGLAKPLTAEIREKLLRRYFVSMGNIAARYNSLGYLPRVLWEDRLKLLQKSLSEKTAQLEEAPDTQIVLVEALENNLREVQQALHQVSATDPLLTAAAQGDLFTIISTVDQTRRGSKERGLLFKRCNVDGYNALHLAVLSNQPDAVKALANFGIDIDSRNAQNYTALHMAVKLGLAEMVALLLSLHADPNAQGEYGRTPMHLAAFDGRTEVADQLIKASASVNVKTTPEDQGKMPLHDAAAHGHLATVQLLVNSGAVISALTSNGISPMEETVYSGSLPLVQFLAEQGAPIDMSRTSLQKFLSRPELREIKEYLETKFNSDPSPAPRPF